MRSADWRVIIGAVVVALGLLLGFVGALNLIVSETLFWLSGGLDFFASILRYSMRYNGWSLLMAGVALFIVGLFSFVGAERTRPLRKVVIVLFCAGVILLITGMGIYAFGMQRTVLTEIRSSTDPPVMEVSITLDPKEQHTSRFWVDVNEPSLAPNGVPSSYILIYYNISGNVRLYYKDPTGETVGTSLLSGSGTTTLSSSLAGYSELVLENVGDTEAKISHFYAYDYFYGLREDREIAGIGGIPALLGFAIMGTVVVLTLHDSDKI